MTKRDKPRVSVLTRTVYRAVCRIDYLPTQSSWEAGDIIDPQTMPEGLNIAWLIERERVVPVQVDESLLVSDLEVHAEPDTRLAFRDMGVVGDGET